MQRSTAHICALACAATMMLAAPPARAQTLGGTITYLGQGTLTIETGGRMVGMLNALTAAAEAVTAQDLPYVWAGGHAEAGLASAGSRGGPGYNGRRVGYDCSGAVAAVLASAGLWPAGSPVPGDAGVIRELRQNGLIAHGPGRAPGEVTLYDNPGVHIFMNIDGRFFGTSDGRGGGNSRGGAGWLDDGAPDATSRLFKRYHVLPSVLRDRTSYGHSYTFHTDPSAGIVDGAEVGDRVKVSYAETRSGSMVATAIEYAGQITARGTVTSISADGSALTIQTPAGAPITLSTAGVASLLDGVQIGDSVRVTYAQDAAGHLIGHGLTILSAPSDA